MTWHYDMTWHSMWLDLREHRAEGTESWGNIDMHPRYHANEVNVNLHLDVNGLISFRLGMIVHTIEFYSLNLVWMSRLSFKITATWESKSICVIFLQISQLILMKFSVTTSSCFAEAHSTVIIQRRYAFLGDFVKTPLALAWVWMLMNSISFFLFLFLQAWYDDRHHWTPQFNISLSDLDLHSKLHSCQKAETCAVILLWSFMK